jgi:hypothetical protein
MANSVASVALQDYWYDGKREHVVGTIALTNFNYITNGIVVPFTGQEFIKSATSPVVVLISGIAGFIYVWDYVNLTIRIFQTGAGLSSALAEQVNGAPLTAGISTDTIKFYAIFKLI